MKNKFPNLNFEFFYNIRKPVRKQYFYSQVRAAERVSVNNLRLFTWEIVLFRRIIITGIRSKAPTTQTSQLAENMEVIMNLVYEYDGSPEGFLCCVYRSFAYQEMPLAIRQKGKGQMLIDECVILIISNITRARKVYASLDKIGPDAKDFVKKALLTCLEDKEVLLLQWLKKAYRIHSRIFDRLTDKTVYPLERAILSLEREVHNYLGFIRFSIYRNVLLSNITPKNQVLPLLGKHFSDRFPEEYLLIHDQTHEVVLIHEPGLEFYLTQADKFVFPESGKQQEYYEDLWKCFCEHISIRERENRLCQLNHLPLRYREDMVEFSRSRKKGSDLLPA